MPLSGPKQLRDSRPAQRRRWALPGLVCALLCMAGDAGPLAAQAPDPGHAHASPERRAPVAAHAGAHAVLFGTHVRNAVGGEPDTELYLTQPTLFAGASLWGGSLEAMATVSLEGVTLEGGELAPGAYGEGYVDRRHPHTYLHEAVLTAQLGAPARGVSLTAGRGFAPFGTDDPMARPFVRFPVNHHLGQILERLVVIGAARRGPVLLEAGLFNGDEPSDASDLGTPDRFADSWSARLTLLPAAGVELQGSYADVESPELPTGGGWDQRKLSLSARVERGLRAGALYGLVEWKRTTEVNDGEAVFSFGSVLAETSLAHAGWRGGVRLERSDRPESDRIGAYRTPWPHAELHVLGITRWTTATLMLERRLRLGLLRAAPFVEAAWAHVGERERGLFERERMYGGSSVRSLSAGVRLDAGHEHTRMGRYGIALVRDPAQP